LLTRLVLTPSDSPRTLPRSCSSEASSEYDPRMSPGRPSAKPKSPGLRKARGVPLVERRTLELYRSSDYRWRELFECADVMSEGATRQEPDGATYYGSTSVLLPFASRGGGVPDELGPDITQVIASDPHARLRAVRIACLEAQVRSNGRIGRVRAELCVRADAHGVRVDVDVEARVFADAQPRPPHRTVPVDSKRGAKGA
jgi:hypothetical protein